MQFAGIAILAGSFWLISGWAVGIPFACAVQAEIVVPLTDDSPQASSSPRPDLLTEEGSAKAGQTDEMEGWDKLENADASVLSSQSEPSQSEPSQSEPSQSEPRQFTATHLFQLSLMAAIIIWGYSLVMSGKHGTGWLVLATIFGIFAYFGRLIKSVFQEVTSSNEVKDWDDE